MTDVGTTMEPADWPSPGERRFARAQADLADHYGVDAHSRVLETTDVGPVHFLVAGDPGGRPVFLLHGITAPAASWLPLVPCLSDRYRLYMPDMPGEGLSSKPDYGGTELRSFLVADLLELMSALDVGRLDVVGHSFGALRAFLLAVDYDRVDRLCLAGGPLGVTRTLPLLPRLLTIRGLNRLLFRLLRMGDQRKNAREWIRRFGVVDDSSLPDVFFEMYASRSDVPGLDRSLRSLLSRGSTFGRVTPLADLTADLVHLDRPTRFVWGTDDYYWDPEVGQKLVNRMPDAEIRVLEDHGHAVWLEPGDEAPRLIRGGIEH